MSKEKKSEESIEESIVEIELECFAVIEITLAEIANLLHGFGVMIPIVKDSDKDEDQIWIYLKTKKGKR